MSARAVYLIGAGPGDPGLMTLRGLEYLQRADVVIHDHLVSSRLLRHARPDAELIDVGLAAPRPWAQEAISYLLVEKAREGKTVARLKWGDPFVFDSGGEEAVFLREQQIPFEVVPGIPAGIAVPAYAGVPLTWAGEGDTLTLVRGYEDERRGPPDVDWASLARLDGTVVCYVGAQQLPRVLELLQTSGWPADGPAVIVYGGTMPGQTSVAGTLGSLIDASREQPRREPAILVAGRTVRFRTRLRWFETRPLAGQRVLVTRPREQAAELVEQLAALGAAAIEAPVIRIVPPDDLRPLQQAAADPQVFDWIVFTSANAVDAFMTVLLDGTRDLRALKGPVLCAVGTGTAARLRHYGITADLVPDEFRAEAVAAAIVHRGAIEGRRVLLPRSDIGREVIADQLQRTGARVTEVIAYRTVLEDRLTDRDPDIYRMLLDGQIDVVTFTSASAVRNFVKLYGNEQVVDLLRRTVVAVIGPVTADAATRLGITVTVQPSTYTVTALVEAIAAHAIATRPASGRTADRTIR